MRRIAPILAIALLTAAPASAQRPRIGVALSGGAARGLAHVGVLRVLEEKRVPVDFVAGTSMGAIVGGLYASGLSPDELEFLSSEARWDAILEEGPPRGSLDFRRKALERRHSFEMEIGLTRRGLRLPGGLIPGQELGLLLRRHTLPVSPIHDFSRLPVPFAAVATDFETGDRVILERGDLALAMRASMAMPIVFSPVPLGDRLLVDGGIASNLPVDIARSLGADVVIAVDATLPLKGGDDVRTLLGAIDQLVALQAREDLERQRAAADLVVDPALEGVGLFDFRRSDSIVARGAEAARAAAGALASLGLSPAEYEAWRAERRVRPSLPDEIDEIRIEGPPWLDERRARARLALAPGDSPTADALEEAARSVYAIGEFERVEYDLAIEGDRTIAVIRAVEQPWGANTLRFGARLIAESGVADFRTARVTFTGSIGFERSRLNARGGAWRLGGRFGQVNALATELDQPLDFAGRWFAAPRASIEDERQPLFVDEDLAAEYGVRRALLGFDLGRRIDRWAELRTGLRWGRVTAEIESGPADLLPALADDRAALVATATIDGLDDADFPRRGAFLHGELVSARRVLGGDRRYDRLELEAKAFATRGRWTGFGALTAGSSLGTELPAYEEFRLGGFLSLSGYGPGELRGAYGGAARVGGFFRVVTLPPARGLYAGAWIEAGNAWRDSGEIDLDELRPAATAALAVDTVLGPVYVAYGRAEAGRGRVYVALGTAP